MNLLSSNLTGNAGYWKILNESKPGIAVVKTIFCYDLRLSYFFQQKLLPKLRNFKGYNYLRNILSNKTIMTLTKFANVILKQDFTTYLIHFCGQQK